MGSFASSHAEAGNSSQVAAVSAAVVAAIGATVILGWNLGSESLIAIHPGSAAVQYNTALGLLCSSVSLWALVCGRRRLATVLAASVLLLAAATAVEYLASVDLSIDTAFFNTLAGRHVSGRMAPNTVTAFVCIAVALLLVAAGRRWKHVPGVPGGRDFRPWGWSVEVAASLCAVVVAVGAVAFTGHLANIPSAYEWSPGHPIAVLTTVAFLALAAGVIAAAWHDDRGSGIRAPDAGIRMPGWLPAPVFVLLMSLCGMIAKSLWHTSRIAVLPEARHSLVFSTVLVLVFGAAVSSALLAVIRLAQKAYEKSLDLEALNRALDTEMLKSRKAAHYVRSLIEASLDPLVTINREGKITDVNRATEAATGRSREELIGSDFCDYFTEPAKARAGYQSVFEHAVVRDYPLVIRDAAGGFTDVLYNASLYRGEQGEIEGVFAAARDISERKRAEEQVLRASLYARSLLEASLDPLVTISKDGRIMDVNRATEQVTGIARQQLIGSDFSDYFMEPDKAREGYQRVFSEGSVRDYPLAIRSRTGAITDVLYNASLFKDQDGRVEGIFAAARDITERKRAQEELQRFAAQLERSNTELQEFAFVASHDLQEPLRKITAFSERLRERSLAQLDDTSRDYLARMDSAAVRMSRLIESLLDYSRVTTRALPFERVDLCQLALGVVSDLEQRIRESGARITIGRLPLLDGDATQMRQLLQNLIGNALKFRSRSCAPRIAIRGAQSGGRWQLSVADNGIGFDPAFADRIFRPFQRLHGRNEYEGSGMGLAICRKIAQRHGATISVHTAPGKGATFTVSFSPTSERTDSCQEMPYASSSPKTMTTTTC